MPLSTLAGRDLESDDSDSSTDTETRKPPPPLDELVAAIPAENKQVLEELFRARFRTVRRIRPDQLR